MPIPSRFKRDSGLLTTCLVISSTSQTARVEIACKITEPTPKTSIQDKVRIIKTLLRAFTNLRLLLVSRNSKCSRLTSIRRTSRCELKVVEDIPVGKHAECSSTILETRSVSSSTLLRWLLRSLHRTNKQR